MKIGAFTFGGGYAMIPIIQREAGEKRKWIRDGELLDIIAIAESTPGPIAVNAATYVGYKVAGFWGSLFATIGLAIPSFVIIFVISFFYKDFISWPWVSALFKGLKVGVIILLFKAVLKLKKNISFNCVSIILFVTSLCGLLILSLFQISFPCMSLVFIAFGLLVGLVLEFFNKKKGEKQ